MNLVCVQPSYLAEHRRALDNIPLPIGDGQLLFLGIPGKLRNVEGSYLMRYRAEAKKSKGIVLYFGGTKFEVDKAEQLSNEIKFFIDGVEVTLGKHVIIVGCKGRYILNENRWPEKAEVPDHTILQSEQKEV